MKKHLLIALGLGFAVTAAQADTNNTAQTATPSSAVSAVSGVASSAIDLSNTVDKTSYAVGVTLGKNFHKQDVDINAPAFVQGFEAGLHQQASQLTDQQIEATMQAFQQTLIAKQATLAEKQAQTNSTAGDDFLAKNKAEKGVQTLADGLQYKIITPGTGEVPTDSSVVTVDYEGKLIGGKVFDSSYERGQPATFAVGDVIKGWQEALSKMKTGATWEVVVPADLAYGKTGIPGHIGPNETLVFKIHLISVKDANAAASADSSSSDSAAQSHS